MNKKNFESFHTFIKKMIIKINRKVRVTRECKDILNVLIIEFTKNIILKSCYMAKEYNKNKINVKNIETIINILYKEPPELFHKAHAHLEKFNTSFLTEEPSDPNQERQIRSNVRANLTLHPTRFKNLFEKYKYADIQVFETCIIFLTSIVEIIFKNVISSAIDIMFMNGKITLTGEYIYKAIKGNIFFQGNDIIGYGLC